MELYRDFYADDPFVHVLDAGTMPKTSSVAGTNYAHVGIAVNATARMLVAVGAIDNLAGRGQPGRAVRERRAGLAPGSRARTDLRTRVTRIVLAR